MTEAYTARMEKISSKHALWAEEALKEKIDQCLSCLVLPGEDPDPERRDQMVVGATAEVAITIRLNFSAEDSIEFIFRAFPNRTGTISFKDWKLPIGDLREVRTEDVARLAIRAKPVVEVMCT